mmetsp:Transcript_3026/g.5107  ORF Transcript_3026/g.5107 Transcript_3026/m.5107 type:complete len:304 (+) Transcript_3026:208-1119(+)
MWTRLGRQAKNESVLILGSKGNCGGPAWSLVTSGCSLDVEEDDNAGDVVDHALLLPPSLEGGAHQVLGRPLCVFLQVERVNYFGDVDVLQELPDSIARDYHHLVILRERVLVQLGLGVAPHRVGHRVSKRTRHRQTRHILALEPDAKGTQRITILIPVGVYPAVVGVDPLRLVLVIRLVVPRQSLARALILRVNCRHPLLLERLDHDSSRVADISNVKLPAHGHHAHAGGSTVSSVLGHVANLLLGYVEGLAHGGVDDAGRRVLLGEVVAPQVLLHLVLDVEGESVLEQPAHLAPILAVTIAD